MRIAFANQNLYSKKKKFWDSKLGNLSKVKAVRVIEARSNE
jgi:hypothetical protein